MMPPHPLCHECADEQRIAIRTGMGQEPMLCDGCGELTCGFVWTVRDE